MRILMRVWNFLEKRIRHFNQIKFKILSYYIRLIYINNNTV